MSSNPGVSVKGTSCANQSACRLLSKLTKATASHRIWPIRSASSDSGSPPPAGRSARSSLMIPASVIRSRSLAVTTSSTASNLNHPTRRAKPFSDPAATHSQLLASFQGSLSRPYVVTGKAIRRERRRRAMAQTEAGYRGKWKKWLAIYLVAAAVVYLIVFLVFFNHGGGGGGFGY
jgi:hypothetical protein